MTSSEQTAANRRNALASTGPRTAAGKARSSRNALRHGLRADLPVLPGERAEDWEAHRDGILRSLAPADALEAELAGRVALCLWRLRRAAAYETAVTAVGLEEVADAVRAPDPFEPGKTDAEQLERALRQLEEKREAVGLGEGALRLLTGLLSLPDDARLGGDDVCGAFQDVNGALPDFENSYFDTDDEGFLAGLGVPEDDLQDAYHWDGWTAGMVRRAVAQIAQDSGVKPERLLGRAAQDRREAQDAGKAEVKRLGREVTDLRRRVREREERLRLRRMLPDGKTLETVTRYEAHLSRQLLQAQHTLERLQAARAGRPVPPPAALDVTVNAPTPEPNTAAAEGAGRP
jgi:hypothetical protein